MQLRTIPSPVLPAPDWAVARTCLCGLCGSDYKQVFMNGNFDNPMTAMISWPQVLGHEVVAVIDEIGPDVTEREIGDRVVLNPWLSCEPRGLEPCRSCEVGALAQCRNFARGVPAPGIHTGNSATATGGFAPRVPAHQVQWIPIPDEVSDEEAVLADPFSVSLHAILASPPKPGGTALVYGAGTLGLLAIAILRALYPDVRVAAVARFDHQATLAEQFGAERVYRHRPTRQIIEEVAELTGAGVAKPWRGLPMLNGGVDVLYDTVSSPETLEVGLRIADSRSRIVALGVEPPRRFEWTPLYFKEILLVGSNGFGIEEHDGRRQHAMEWYFEFIRTKRIDVTAIITHRYRLEAYREAFMTCYDQGKHAAIKVLFDGFPDEGPTAAS
ncbi:MAG: zinc-binding dehydrogenase [Deltaproteobacteria bacterium]|nr:zinc-binding dehydrogenase [Deltaproteobacteria bacterium]MBW2448168.1 zinc-binding dehydrogenase [Deltaproteobacteria bacterium]